MSTSKEKTKNLVAKATKDDRNPPSGYLLKELANRTLSISECQAIEDLVIKKLEKNKPYIKYKALRIIKFLCENGSPNWRRAWQRSTEKLRDAQQFRGPPDPIYGDAPYQQVRKAAKDAMQAVFQQSTIDSSHIKKRIQSIDGTSAYSGYSGSSSTSTFGSGSSGTYGGSSLKRKNKAPTAPNSWENRVSAPKQMQGFGNTSYTPAAATTTFKPLKSPGTYSNPGILSASNPHSRGKIDNRGVGGSRKRGKIGGVWGDGDKNEEEEEVDDYEEPLDEDDYNNDEFPSEDIPKKKRFGGNIKKSRNKKSDGHYEKMWVANIIKGGGIGAKIPDINKYVQQFENLSKSQILDCIDQKLEDSTWQKQGKALTLINGLLNGKSRNIVIDYFSQSPDNIQAMCNANKSILRRKANAIISQLNIEEEDEDEEEEDDDEDEDDNNDYQQQQTKPQQQTNDLLNMNMGAAIEPAPQKADVDIMAFASNLNEDEPEEDDGDGDMFGGLEQNKEEQNNRTQDTGIMNLMPDDALPTKEELQSNANKRKADDYAFLDDLASNTNVKQNDGGNATDILMGFTNTTTQQPNTNNNNNQSSTTGPSAFGFDLGGGGGGGGGNAPPNNNAPPVNVVGGDGSAFGFDLGGGGNTNQSTQQTSAQQTTASSAFGFSLNQPQTQNTTQNINTMNTMNNNMNTMNSMSGNAMGMMSGMNNMNNMNNRNNMMTSQMLQQNANNRQFVNNNMNQMNQLGNMMNNMNMNNNMMNQMRMNQGMMGQNTNMSAFQQTMQSVGQPQQQRQPQTYNHNDPFAQMMTTGASQPVPPPQRTTKRGPDPFSEFSIGSLQ